MIFQFILIHLAQQEIIMINSEIVDVNSKSQENEGKTIKRASTDDKKLLTFLEFLREFNKWGWGS